MLRIKTMVNESRVAEFEEKRNHLRYATPGSPGVWRTVTKKFKLWLGTIGRNEVEVDIVKMNARTMWVRLPDGRVIKRKRERDTAR